MLEAGIAVASVALTFGLFHLISVSWPRLYYGPSDGLAIFLSSSLVKFSLFRVLPVALVSSVASAYAIKAEGSATTLAVLYFAIYVLALSTFRFVRRFQYGRKVSLRDVMWLLVASLFTLLGSILGLVCAPLLEPLLPGVSVSRDALFTALLVAVVMGFMQRVMLDEELTDKAMRRAIEQARPLTSLVEADATRKGVARWLISAIVVAEQMQRPKWFQSFESLAYSAGLPVTVGPFQGGQRPRGELVDQVSIFMRSSPAVDFASRVQLGEIWTADGVERATYALHNDAEPFVQLCRRVRELLIEGEFDAAVTPPELDETGIEFGPLRLRSSGSQLFSFKLHLKSDSGGKVRLVLGESEDLANAVTEVLAPGDTIERCIYGSEADSEWTLRIVGDEGSECNFRPLRDLEFRTSWNG